MSDNQKVRELFEQMLNEYGLKMKWVAGQLELSYNTLSRWKCGRLDYGQGKLNKINNFLNQLIQ